MKKILFLLIICLLLNSYVFAQLGERTQRGRATQELINQGLVASHFNIPLDSIVRILNTETQKEIEVKIIGRIPASSTRIIDLSREAYETLELTNATIVILSYTPTVIIRTFDPNEHGEDEEVITIVDEKEDTVIIETIIETIVEHTVTERTIGERPRLNSSLPVYQLIVLDRARCVPNADIEVTEGITVLYKFLHEANRYLVAVYVSNGDFVFPTLPENSYIITHMATPRRRTIVDYINSVEFQVFVWDQGVLNNLVRALK